MNYDLIIIGGGPAGAAAGVYAARKYLKSVLIAKNFGGQSAVSDDIQNWIGTPHIAGTKLAENLEKHVREYAGNNLEIVTDDEVITVQKKDTGIIVTTAKGKTFESKALLITTGSKRRKLTVPGADKFEHKGLTYCASCDGPMFSGKDVIVVGGGNAGFETAAQLLSYVKSVTLFEYGEKFRAEAITVEKVTADPKMSAFNNVNIIELKGEKMLESVVYKDNKTGEVTEKKAQGIFVEIGQMPATELIEGVVELNNYKQVVVDPKTQRTSTEGIWAAGDCTDVIYHQNNIAVGDAVRAMEDIYVCLKTK